MSSTPQLDDEVTATIVAAYLDYAAKMASAQHVWTTVDNSWKSQFLIGQNELPTIIRAVRTALKQS
jgi:predicted transcriptional regulator